MQQFDCTLVLKERERERERKPVFVSSKMWNLLHLPYLLWILLGFVAFDKSKNRNSNGRQRVHNVSLLLLLPGWATFVGSLLWLLKSMATLI